MSIDALQSKIRALKNPTMVGLDPTPELLPAWLLAEARASLGYTPAAAASAYRTFCLQILEELRELVPAVKVQSACFQPLGAEGVRVMQEILQAAREMGYYVLLDSMQWDAGNIAQVCAGAIFGTVEAAAPGYQPYPCDGVTLNGYLGTDSVKPFLPYCRDQGKNLFVLVKTSNRSSVEIQDLVSGGRLVHTAMADLVSRWGQGLYGQCGYSQVAAVVGASYSEVQRSLRAKYDRMFFLVPGYGAQGGTAKSVQYAFDRLGHGAVICASRSILGAWQKGESDGRDFAQAARQAAEKMKKDLSKYVTVL